MIALGSLYFCILSIRTILLLPVRGIKTLTVRKGESTYLL